MHTVSYEFLMKPEESAGCHQTLSSRVGAGHETSSSKDSRLHKHNVLERKRYYNASVYIAHISVAHAAASALICTVD